MHSLSYLCSHKEFFSLDYRGNYFLKCSTNLSKENIRMALTPTLERSRAYLPLISVDEGQVQMSVAGLNRYLNLTSIKREKPAVTSSEVPDALELDKTPSWRIGLDVQH